MPRNIYDIKHVMKTEDKKIDEVIFEIYDVQGRKEYFSFEEFSYQNKRKTLNSNSKVNHI